MVPHGTTYNAEAAEIAELAEKYLLSACTAGPACSALIDVRDQVAEVIDAQDLAVDPVGADLRLRDVETMNWAGRSAQRPELDAFREPRRRWREAIAAFERAAHRRARILPLRQLDHA